MNQGDLAIDQAANQDLRRVRDLAQDREHQSALGMRPPAALDGFSRDGLGQPWRGSLRRSENDTVLLDERERCCGRTDRLHGPGEPRAGATRNGPCR